MTRRCARCDKQLAARLPNGRRLFYCGPCQVARFVDNGGQAAHRAVQAAVSRGQLRPAKECNCVDCGKPARDYDHRDYAKHLEVAPVCRSCNRRRGPARPVLTFELPDDCAIPPGVMHANQSLPQPP